jgi:hypothetical protein
MQAEIGGENRVEFIVMGIVGKSKHRDPYQ